MDIGPISPIRPVVRIQTTAPGPDLSRVFEVEYLGQPDDDEYTPGNGKPTREPENEAEGKGTEVPEEPEAEAHPLSHESVSLFA